MIVVDTNIIAYLYLPGDFSAQTELLRIRYPNWAAPTLWRSELRNVLALYMRKRVLSLQNAHAIQTEAEALLDGCEYQIPSLDILILAQSSNCSAYDCEFVALAMHLNVPLITADKQILAAFPSVARTLQTALA